MNGWRQTANEDEFFDVVTDFYKAYGVGMFGLNKAFRIASRTRESCGILSDQQYGYGDVR